MNGRVYDALLGRFLSADVVVQNPTSLQSYNRYSYVQNNPLTMVDPTGFMSEKERQEKEAQKTVTRTVYLVTVDGKGHFERGMALRFTGTAAAVDKAIHIVKDRMGMVPDHVKKVDEAGPVLKPDGTVSPDQPVNSSGPKAAISFFDSKAVKQRTLDGQNLSGAEEFAAGAEQVSPGKGIPVGSEKDIEDYFKANPGKVPSIGLFFHGEESEDPKKLGKITLAGKEISDRTLKLIADHVETGGSVYGFVCHLAEGREANRLARDVFRLQQTLHAPENAVVMGHYQPNRAPEFPTGIMKTVQDPRSYLNILVLREFGGERK